MGPRRFVSSRATCSRPASRPLRLPTRSAPAATTAAASKTKFPGVRSQQQTVFTRECFLTLLFFFSFFLWSLMEAMRRARCVSFPPSLHEGGGPRGGWHGRKQAEDLSPFSCLNFFFPLYLVCFLPRQFSL